MIHRIGIPLLILMGTFLEQSSFASESMNLLQSLVSSSHVHSYDLQILQGGETVLSFLSYGLPRVCQVGVGRLQNEAIVNIISDRALRKPLRIQVVGTYPAPLSRDCVTSLSTVLTQLPLTIYSVSNNLNTMENGGQMVLEFSVPRPLPDWLQDAIPAAFGGKASLPSQVEGWKLTVICLMFLFVGFRLILSEAVNSRS